MNTISITAAAGKMTVYIGNNMVETTDYLEKINGLRIEMHEDYFETARDYLGRAYKALKKADANPEHAISTSLGELKMAHQETKKFLTETKKKRILIFPYTTKVEKDSVKIHRYLQTLSLMLHELSCLINNLEKVNFWYKDALENMNSLLFDFREKHGSVAQSYDIQNGDKAIQINFSQYIALTKISPSYAFEKVWAKSEWVGYDENMCDIYKENKYSTYHITSKGIEFCRYQEDLIFNRTKTALNKSIELLPLSEFESKKYKLTRFADEILREVYGKSVHFMEYLEVAKIKLELAILCHSQNYEKDALLYEKEAREYILASCKIKNARYNFWHYDEKLQIVELKRRFKFISGIHDVPVQKKILNELLDVVLEGKGYGSAEIIKAEISKITM